MVFVGVGLRVAAQVAVPPPLAYGQFQPSQLDQMVEPIALYPDPLLAQVLPAATQPAQIVLAYTYVTQGGDPNQVDQQPWDSSVRAVAHYPNVLTMLEGNLAWTTALGQAFLNQPTDVMNSVQRLRAQAEQLGNLQTTPQEEVMDDDGTVEIVPTDPDMLYVPVYDPGVIFFQRGFGRPFISFGAGFRIGGWLDHDFDWRGHNVIVWGSDHRRPADWWHQRPSQRPAEVVHNAPVWRSNVRPATVPSRGGDRGYEARPAAPVQAPARQYTPRPVEHETPAPRPVEHAAPAPRPVEHAAPAPRPVERPSAFGGAQSAPAVRAESSRGVASRQAAPPAESGSHGRR